jgi:hypothetical protein
MQQERSNRTGQARQRPLAAYAWLVFAEGAFG